MAGAPIPPRAPAIFIGRAADLDRFAAVTAEVRLGLVYGVGGIGKTAFLLHAAEALAQATGGRVAYHSCREGEGIATLAAAILAGLDPGSSAAPGSAAMAALLAASRLQPLVLCADDVHRADPGLLEALVHLAQQRGPLWIAVGSRQDLAVDPAVVDHLVIRLAGLSGVESAALWERLEQLYGAPRRRRDDTDAGNPLLIKQAFASAGTRSPADPMGLGALSPLAREILALAAAFRHPAPLAALAGERAGDEVAAAVTELERRFLLEVSPSGECAAHDVVREQVLRSPLAPGGETHRRCLSALDARPGDFTAIDGEREALHHAVRAGDDERAEAILVARAAPAARAQAPGAVLERELADAIDQLSARRRLPMSVRLLRERLRSRRGGAISAERATAELARGGDPSAVLDHAELALTLGRTVEALKSLARLADESSLGPLERMWWAVLSALAHNARGDVGAAHLALDGVAPLFAATGALGEALRRACDVVIEADREDYDAACLAIADVHRLLPGPRGVSTGTGSAIRHASSPGPPPLGVPLMTSVERLAATALGRAARGAWADDDELFAETLLLRLPARLLRAQEMLIRGQAVAAATLLEATMSSATAAGFGPFLWWGAWLLGEAETIIGSPAEARRQVARHLEAARSGQWVRGVVRMEATLARALLASGDLDEACRRARAAMANAADLPGTRARLRAATLLAAAAAGEPVEPEAGESLEGHARQEWELTRVELMLAAGSLDDARHAAAAIASRCDLAGWRLLACHARLRIAEAAYRQADAPAASRELDAARDVAERERYESSAVRSGLLAAALARMRRDAAGARRLLEACAARARARDLTLEAAAADIGLAALDGRERPGATPAARLARRLGLSEPLVACLRDRNGHYDLTEDQRLALDAGRYGLVIDVVGRQVHAAGRTFDLSRRDALVQLLAVLARSPGETISCDVIARSLWDVEYHPLQHHSRLTVQATRLRKAIGAAWIDGDAGGYRLAAPASWAVVERSPQGSLSVGVTAARG